MRMIKGGLGVAVFLAAASAASAQPSCPNPPGFTPAPAAGLDKIKHVIVLMQENRSWDSYFGTIGIPQCGTVAPGERCVDKLPPGGASNIDPANPSGPPIKSFHQTKYCTEDTSHGWSGSHVEFNRTDPNSSTGFNDGFTEANVTAGDPSGRRAMGYYDAGDLNYYHSLIQTFAFGDQYFSSLLGPTYPNRMYLLAATTFGHVQNDLPPIPNGFPVPSILSRLDDAGLSWKNYFFDLPQAGLFYDSPNTHFVPMPTFFADLATCIVPELCQLPDVSFVDPVFLIAGITGHESTDEHPRNDIQDGQAFVALVTNALMASPVWKESAMFFVYDEAGGFYDHVVPPAACVPDDYTPGKCADLPDGTCTRLGQPSVQGLGRADTAVFDRYGFRTPNAVISPWVKPGYVSHKTYDHTSVLKFIETRFGLPALTKRDANAEDMLDFFDFSQPDTAPLMDGLAVLRTLPTPAFDPVRAVRCVGEGITMSDEAPLP